MDGLKRTLDMVTRRVDNMGVKPGSKPAISLGGTDEVKPCLFCLTVRRFLNWVFGKTII